MKINQPLTEKDHKKADEQHAQTRANQHEFLNEVADKIRAGEPLSGWEKEWAAGAIRAFADTLPSERKKPAGKAPKVPEEAIIMRQVQIESHGLKVTEAEKLLAEQYGVDLETIQYRIKRLRQDFKKKGITPADWGLNSKDWGA